MDARPRVLDGITKQMLLVDSGAAITIIPPSQTDVVNPNMLLQTVSGQKLKCYGHRLMQFRFGRKQYQFSAVIADVKDIIIGWDFMQKYRIDLVWDEFGNIHFYDKIAKIKTLMEYKTFEEKIPRALRVEYLEETMTHPSDVQFFQVHSINSLKTEKRALFNGRIQNI